MEDPLGLTATIINALLFLFISLYLGVFKKNKDASHFLFSFMTFSLFIYSVMEALKFAGDYNLAITMAKLSPSFLALGAYFFLLFTYYLKIGWNRDLAILSFLPIVFVVIFSYEYLIENVKYTHFGWVAIFNFYSLLLYSLLLAAYFIIGLWNLLIIYKNIERELRKRVLYFIIGGVAVILFSLLFILQIMENEYVLPFLNLSLVFLGLLYFYALLK